MKKKKSRKYCEQRFCMWLAESRPRGGLMGTNPPKNIEKSPFQQKPLPKQKLFQNQNITDLFKKQVWKFYLILWRNNKLYMSGVSAERQYKRKRKTDIESFLPEPFYSLWVSTPPSQTGSTLRCCIRNRWTRWNSGGKSPQTPPVAEPTWWSWPPRPTALEETATMKTCNPVLYGSLT